MPRKLPELMKVFLHLKQDASGITGIDFSAIISSFPRPYVKAATMLRLVDRKDVRAYSNCPVAALERANWSTATAMIIMAPMTIS